MSAKGHKSTKSGIKGIFSFIKPGNASSLGPPQAQAPTEATSAGDSRGISSQKDSIQDFLVALDLLKSVGDGDDLLAPLRAVCAGLKVLVGTVEAIQKNGQDLGDLNTRLHRHLDALMQQDKTLSAPESNLIHKDVEDFVKSLNVYILDLNKVEKSLDTLQNKEGGTAKKFFKKALMVHSVPEEIKECSHQLDASFQQFMNSVTAFIAQKVVLLSHDLAKMKLRDDERKTNGPLAQLPYSDARGSQHDTCLEGTREGILQSITEWATNEADKPIFCLIDQAGTGKSTISNHMAQKWEKEGVPIGRFFFSVPNAITNANDLPTTLARDVASNGPSLRSLIANAISDHPNITDHSMQEKLKWLVFMPLKRRRDGFSRGLEEVRKKMEQKAYSQAPESLHPEIVERSEIKDFEASYRQALEQVEMETDDGSGKEVLEQAYTAYTEALEKAYIDALSKSPIIVIDAVDECTVVERGILLESLLNLLEDASLAEKSPLKLFLTSRKEADILLHIEDPRRNALVRQVDFGVRSEGNSSDHDDIRLYANRNLVEVLSAEEIDQFVSRANGRFIWAATARAFLEGALKPSTRLENLITVDTKSSALEVLYDQILRWAMDQVESGQKGKAKNVLQGELKKVLQVVCTAREPLTTRVMDEILGLSNGAARRVLNMLRSVLSDGSGDKPVHALHHTFVEYLRAGSQPSDILFSDGESETLLAGGCLDILLSPQLRYDIGGIAGPDRLPANNQDAKGLLERLETNTTQGLRYAAVYGLSHVTACHQDGAVFTKLRKFLANNLLHWVELTSLLEGVPRLMQSVHLLESEISEGTGLQSMEFSNAVERGWFEEIFKLVQPFQVVIEKSALQVYFSALPFAPSTSRISHTYSQGFLGKIPRVRLGAWPMRSRSTILSGHGADSGCLAFSPDGRTLASASKDHIVRLWDVASGAAIRDLRGHTEEVTCLSFSPDGKTLATGSKDQTVRRWNIATGAIIGRSLVHTKAITCISFSPDGQRLASGSSDRTLRLWNPATSAAIGGPLTGHTAHVACLSFSPDGRRLASGSNDRTIRLWNTTTRTAIGEPLTGHTKFVTCLSFSPDGKTLASGSWDRTVRLWNTTTRAAIGQPLKGHTKAVTCFAFSPDGRNLASGSNDYTVRLWDTAKGTAMGDPLTGHTKWVPCLYFSADGQTLTSGSNDGTIRLWNAKADATIGEPLSGHNEPVTCLSFSPNGKTLASGSQDHTVQLWNVATGSTIGKSVRHDSVLRSLSFHTRDGGQLVAVNNGPAVWKVSDGGLVKFDPEQQIPERPAPVVRQSKQPKFDNPWTYIQSSSNFHFSLPSSFKCLTFSAHGNYLAYGGEDGSVIIVDCSHIT